MNYKNPLSLWLILIVSFHATQLFADMVKGNPDTKICHMETCKYANSKGCTMALRMRTKPKKWDTACAQNVPKNDALR